MHETFRSCPADNRERKEDDEHKEDDLDQRGEILKPSKNRVGHYEDDAGYDQKDGDCLHGQQSAISRIVNGMKNGGYRSATRHASLLAETGELTRGSLGKVSTCPKLDENIEESSFRGNNGGPTCARVNCRPQVVNESFLPSHSAKPAPKAKAGSTHRSA